MYNVCGFSGRIHENILYKIHIIAYEILKQSPQI